MHSAYLYTLNWFRKTVFEKKEFEIVFRSDILLYYYLYIFDSLPITREDKEMLDSLIFTITKFRFQRNDANTKRPYLKHKKIKSRLLSRIALVVSILSFKLSNHTLENSSLNLLIFLFRSNPIDWSNLPKVSPPSFFSPNLLEIQRECNLSLSHAQLRLTNN